MKRVLFVFLNDTFQAVSKSNTLEILKPRKRKPNERVTMTMLPHHRAVVIITAASQTAVRSFQLILRQVSKE